MNLMFLFVGIQGHAMTLRSADNLNYLIVKAFFGNKCIWNVAERHQIGIRTIIPMMITVNADNILFDNIIAHY